MCDSEGDVFCDKFLLEMELRAILNDHTVEDQNGNKFVSLNRVNAMLKKLECEDV